jgi:mannosyltransferase
VTHLKKTWSRSLGRLALLFVVALSLRVYLIDHQSFWVDEVLTLEIAPLPWHQMSDHLQRQDNAKPPLYYLLMHEWLPHGQGEFWARLPSAIIGASTCVVAAVLGVTLLGEYGWLMGVLIAFSPFHIWYSQETRMYSLLAFFASLTFLFHSKYCLDGRWRNIILFAICGSLTCYTFPYGFFIFPVTAASAFFYTPALSRRRLMFDAAAHMAAFSTFLPWMPRMVHAAELTNQSHKGMALDTLGYSFFNLVFGSTLGIPLEQLQYSGRHIFIEHPVEGTVLAFFFAVALGCFLLGLKSLKRDNPNAFIFSLAGSLVLLGAPFAIALVKTVPNNPRYAFVAIFPAYTAYCAFLIDTSKRALLPNRILAALLALGVAVSLLNYYFVSAYSRSNFRAASLYLEEHKKDVDVIFMCATVDSRVLHYYYHGSAPIISAQYPPTVDATSIGADLSLRGHGYKHLALVYARPDQGDPQHRIPWIFQKTFHETGEQKWAGVTCYLFDVPSTK